MRNIPSDHEILAAVNEDARKRVNTDLQPNDPPLPPGFRCDMSRIGFIRRRWEAAVESYKKIYELDPIESLQRIEAELRNSTNVPSLYIDRR